MHSGLIQQLSSSGLPPGTMIRATFYLIAGLTLFAAFRLVVSRNIFHGAIYLAMTLLGIACIYLYLDAEFLALAQILIYVGAVVTLFLFIIMLTANIQDRAIEQTNKLLPVSAVSVAVFLLLLMNIINGNPWQAGRPAEGVFTVARLGKSLMTTYALPFEVLSVTLVAVLVGAIVIGKADNK